MIKEYLTYINEIKKSTHLRGFDDEKLASVYSLLKGSISVKKNRDHVIELLNKAIGKKNIFH